MKEGKSTFRDIFDGDRIFEIPNYQRAYSWEEDHLADFFLDILTQPKDKPYFLGTFLFHHDGLIGEYDKMNIVDGQQRLTTAIILIYSLLTKLEKKGISKPKLWRRYIRDDEVYKLSTSNNDNAFFRTYILGTKKPKSFENNSERRLYEAKCFFPLSLKDLDSSKLIEMLRSIEYSNILIHVVKDKTEAAQIFELINDRGKRLTALEAIKSFLMYQTSVLYNNPDQKLGSIENEFARIYRISERLEGAIREDQLLIYHVIAHLNWEGDNYRTPKELIKNELNLIKNKSEKILFIDEVTGGLKESFEVMEQILANKNGISFIAKLRMLGRIANFYPLLLKSYKYDNTKDKSQLREVANIAELYAFVSAVAGKRADTGVKYFYEITKNFEGDFAYIYKRARILFEENWWRINTEFKVNANKIYCGDKNVSKYILFQYENYLRNKAGHHLLATESFFENDSRLKFSIEHITAKQSKSLNPSKEFEEELLDNIGNLVLDSQATNSSKGNKSVTKKIIKYNIAPLMSQLEIEKIAKRYKRKNGSFSWRKEKDVTLFIEYRRKNIYKYILSDWDYKIRIPEN